MISFIVKNRTAVGIMAIFLIFMIPSLAISLVFKVVSIATVFVVYLIDPVASSDLSVLTFSQCFVAAVVTIFVTAIVLSFKYRVKI